MIAVELLHIKCNFIDWFGWVQFTVLHTLCANAGDACVSVHFFTVLLRCTLFLSLSLSLSLIRSYSLLASSLKPISILMISFYFDF